MTKKTAPDDSMRLPVKLGPASNGEFMPEELPSTAHIRALALRRADEAARRIGMSRRAFLRSSCGVAATLLAINEAKGCNGGSYVLPANAAHELAAAESRLAKDEFIFDVQTHHVSTERGWLDENWTIAAFSMVAPYRRECEESPWIQCYSRDHYLKELFLDSDTDMAVLSVLPGHRGANPLLIEEMAETKEVLAKLESSRRLLLHGFLAPQQHEGRASLRERMTELVEDWKVAAFKLYPIGGPEGDGYFLDDPVRGVPVFEEARKLGVRTIAVHKGIPLPFTDLRYARSSDVGPTATAFPDLQLIIYHAGFETLHREGPYDREKGVGVDSLLRSLEDAGIGPGGNVWVDIGSTFRQLMPRPNELAHVMGKLLKHVGEDRILWGTDSIWYGSPQDQIQAFRAFEIAPELQEKHGYPALTTTAKRKILGLNAAKVYGVDVASARASFEKDVIAKVRRGYEPRPSFATLGPSTRGEVEALHRAQGGVH